MERFIWKCERKPAFEPWHIPCHRFSFIDGVAALLLLEVEVIEEASPR
jgi:hypothetical protein